VQLPPAREILKKAGRGAGYLAAFFVIAAVINWFQAPSAAQMPPVESLAVSTLAGENVAIKTNNGKKTIVYFFAPWCGVCKMSMDALNFFADSKKIQTVAVGLDYDKAEELKPYQEKQLTTVYAGSRDLQRQFKIDRYPTVYILDGNGKVSHVMVGYTSRFGIWIRTLI
jgi:thiol-disulfide isomerase/thioredoxin